MKKKLLRIFLMIIMFFGIIPATSFGSANNDTHKVEAVDHSGGYVYFLKPSTWTESKVMLFIGHNSYTSVYEMTKVTNTDNLYRYSMPSWGGATYVAFANASSVWGSGNWGPSNRTNAPHYTNVYNNYGYNSGNYYVHVPSSTSNNASITIKYAGTSASSLNLSAVAKVYGANNGTTTYSPYASGGTVSVSGYYMSGNNTASTRSAVSSTSSSNTASTTLAPGSTATFKATAAAGYTFVGWSTSTSEANKVSTSTTYTYKYDLSYAEKTIYALFKQSEKKSITIFADLSYLQETWSGDIGNPFLHYWDSSGNNSGNFGSCKMVKVENYDNLYKYEVPLGPNMTNIAGFNFGFYEDDSMKRTVDLEPSSPINISNSNTEYRIVIEHVFTWEQNVEEPKIISGISIDEVIPVTYYDGNEMVLEEKIYGYDYKPRMIPKEENNIEYKLNGWHSSTTINDSTLFTKKTFENNCAESYTLYANYEVANDYFIYVDTLNQPWNSFSVYMWSEYFSKPSGEGTYENAPFPGINDVNVITDIGNNMYKIKIDASASFDHLIFANTANIGDANNPKQTIDLELTPDNNYYVFTTEKTTNSGGTPCYHVKYEEETDNFLEQQKNTSSDVNDFRFIAGFKNKTEAKAYGGASAALTTKQFGYKFIFVKGDTSYVGYWNFEKGYKYDVIRYDGTVYRSVDSTGKTGNDFTKIENDYSEFYALSLTDDVTFKYSDYDQIVVVACYRDTKGQVQVIKAQEYNIVGTPDNVYLYEIER